MLAHTDWGADRKVLLRLYRSLIRSKLDYGSIVYGSARKSYLKMLDSVHHQGLRLALGAFRTSPVESLLAEANEPSLESRREKLALNYISRVKANPDNPVNDVILHPKYEELYERKPKAIRPIGIRLKTAIDNAGLQLDAIREQKIPDIPPWTITQPKVLLHLSNNKKSTTNPLEFRSNFLELKSQYPDHVAVYTDGSKDGDKVGCAFSAEVQAIYLALNFIASNNNRNFIIFSDSLSVLQSLQNRNLSNPLVQQLLIKHHEAMRKPTVQLNYRWILQI